MIGNILHNAGRVFGFNLAPRDPEAAMKAACLAAREMKGRDESERPGVLDWARRAVARRNPIVKGMTDVQPWLYYDRLTAAAGATVATTLMFFTTPLSATKSKLDTNLKQAGRLPDPKHFLVMSLRFIVDVGMNIIDVVALIKNYYVEFEIGDKIFAEGHFDLYPGGAGLDGFGQPATAAAIHKQVANNGVASPMACNTWGKEHGIHILQGQTFQVRAVAPTAVTLQADNANALTPGMNLRCVLDGILFREVQ